MNYNWKPVGIIGQRIQQLITDEGINQSEMGRRLGGVRPSIISYWINGDREPRSATIIRICEEFDVSADWLLGLTDDKKGERRER